MDELRARFPGARSYTWRLNGPDLVDGRPVGPLPFLLSADRAAMFAEQVWSAEEAARARVQLLARGMVSVDRATMRPVDQPRVPVRVKVAVHPGWVGEGSPEQVVAELAAPPVPVWPVAVRAAFAEQRRLVDLVVPEEVRRQLVAGALRGVSLDEADVDVGVDGAAAGEGPATTA